MMQGVAITPEFAVIRHDGDRFASPLHRHVEGQLLYATSGIVSVTTEEGTWVVPPNRAVWLPPGTDHATASRGRVEFRSLLIDARGVGGLPERCRVVEVTPLLRELILKLAELAQANGRSEVAELVARLLLLELSFLPMQPLALPRPRHPNLARLCDTFRDAPSREMSVEMGAAALAMSRATFMRLVRHETGMSFGRWCQQARMLHALTLLAKKRSVLEVALECGYQSPSAFAAAFRRSLGHPPARYFSDARSVP